MKSRARAFGLTAAEGAVAGLKNMHDKSFSSLETITRCFEKSLIGQLHEWI